MRIVDLNVVPRLIRAGQLDAAMRACSDRLAVSADDARALELLGLIALQRGDLAAAEGRLRRSLEIRPDSAPAWNNLATVLGRAGKLDEARAATERAIALKPDYPQARNNLGVVEEQQGAFAEAEAAYRKAIALSPGYAEAHNNLGNVLRRLGKLDLAEASHRQAVRLARGCADAYSGLAAALSDMGDAPGAVECYRRIVSLRPGSASAHSDLLHAMHYLPDVPPQVLFEEAKRWAARHARGITPDTHHPSDRPTHRPLRIGYVSADLREHPVSRFLRPILRHHDASKFEVFCYSGVRRPDAVTADLRSLIPNWRDVAQLSDDALAELIRRDRIDILVDLSGHTPGNRLLVFARRPAPVQITFLGYPDTTGLDVFDARITDALHDPPGLTEHLHAEPLLRLPGCCWCYDPGDDTPPVSRLPALDAGPATFGMTNRLVKVTPQMIRLWSRVLQEVPGSKLLVLTSAASRHDAPVRRLFAAQGFPVDRLELVQRLGRREFLALHARIDVLFDTFPYAGQTTTCDALWMGVPVVSMTGSTHVSRTGAGLLPQVGLDDLVCGSPEEYVQTAVHLAGDRPRLGHLRRELRGQMMQSVLLDQAGYTRAVESAFRNVWAGWCGN